MFGFTPLAVTDNSRFVNSFRDGFSKGEGETGSVLATFLIAITIIGLVLGIAWVVRLMRDGQRRGPRIQGIRLFMTCLRKMGVGRLDRVMLRLAAARCGLTEPSVMLLSDALFAECAGRWISRISVAALRPFASSRIDVVRQQLFSQTAAPAV